MSQTQIGPNQLSKKVYEVIEQMITDKLLDPDFIDELQWRLVLGPNEPPKEN